MMQQQTEIRNSHNGTLTSEQYATAKIKEMNAQESLIMVKDSKN
jgi:hypothetical protein